MSKKFIYFRFTKLGLADGPTPSQPDFPTGRALVFVFCQLKTGTRPMIAFLLTMGVQFWVPLSLCRPAAAPFLEAVGLLLDIPIVVS